MEPDSKEAYRSLFDAIRPQPDMGGPALWMLIGFFGIVSLLVMGSLLFRRRRRAERVHRAFRSLSIERELSTQEEAFLWEMACKVDPEQPVALFSSLAAFEAAVEMRVPTVNAGGQDSEELKLLQTLRRKLGFDHLPRNWSLRHSRQIPAETRIMVGYKRKDDARFCPCVIVESDDAAIQAAPLLRRDQEVLREVEAGERLYVRFWRTGDTEYKFRSRLLEGSSGARDTFRMAHSDSLQRVDQRDFFRLPVSLGVRFYRLEDPDLVELAPQDLHVPEASPIGLEGTIVNISAGGCAVLSGDDWPPDALLVVDPNIRGPFSLGSVICRLIQTEPRQRGYLHYLEFANLPETFQDKLVRELNRRQLERAQE